MRNFTLIVMMLIASVGFSQNAPVDFETRGNGASGGTRAAPTVAATTPTQDAANVISIFSDAYTDIAFDNFDAGWCGGAAVTPVTIDGDNVLKKNAGVVCHGIDFSTNKLDLSAYTHIHFDFYTDDTDLTGDVFNVKLVDFGGGTAEASSLEVNINTGTTPAIVSGSWVSVDVDITALGGVVAGSLTRSDIAQIGITTANLTNVWYDNIYLYNESGGAGGDTEPTTAAPTPTQAEANVISVFSDAYTDIPETNFNPDWGQSTVVTTVDVDGNATLKYATFNYQGTNLGGADGVAQDVSAMEYLHIDMWTADATVVKVFTVSESSGEVAYSLTPITAGSWKSYDIPLSAFAGLTLTDIFQLKFDGQAGVNPSTIYLDNIYFHNEEVSTEPTTAAPTPTVDAANVISIYSDAYTDIAFDNFDAGWCGGAAATGVVVAGNNTLMKNAGVDCHGIDFSTNKQDLSTYTHIHFDFYTDDVDLTGDVFNVKLVDFGGGTAEASSLEVNINTGTTPAIVSGSWVSVDVDITALGGVVAGSLTRSDIAQIGITTANLTNVWYDNIYLYKESGGTGGDTEPTTAAPTPTQAEANVISVFSDAYTDIAETNFNPSWGQSTVVTTEDVAGNATLKYATFNYQGTNLGGADGVAQDVSGMEYLHIDMWTGDATDVKISLISVSSGEVTYSLTPITLGSWNSYDIPMSAFDALDLTDIYQLKFDGQAGVNPSNIYLDNIYFYKEAVALSSDATLSDLQVDGTTVDGFSASVYSYDIELAAGTTEVPAVTATTTDDAAEAVVTPASELPGTTTVEVTAEDGETKQSYTVTFSVASSVALFEFVNTKIYASGSDIYITGEQDIVNGKVVVYDAVGKKFSSRTITNVKEQISINTPGVYMVRITNNNKFITKKVLVK